jgi:hypothetical protein
MPPTTSTANSFCYAPIFTEHFSASNDCGSKPWSAHHNPSGRLCPSYDPPATLGLTTPRQRDVVDASQTILPAYQTIRHSTTARDGPIGFSRLYLSSYSPSLCWLGRSWDLSVPALNLVLVLDRDAKLLVFCCCCITLPHTVATLAVPGHHHSPSTLQFRQSAKKA